LNLTSAVSIGFRASIRYLPISIASPLSTALAGFCEAARHVKPQNELAGPLTSVLPAQFRDAAQPSVRARWWGPWTSAHLGGAKERRRQL